MAADAARVALAALNNAQWCEAVCAAHGVGGRLEDGLWLTRHRPPPFHPNLVTIAADLPRHRLEQAIAGLADAPLAADWGLKDSHAAFDLVPDSFDELFTAHWIWREPRPAAPASTVRRLQAPAERLRWERGWHGLGDDEALPWRQFPDPLWTDARHAFLAWPDAQEPGRIAAGAIASLTPGVVGLSNLYVTTGDRDRAWAALADAAGAAFPGRPVVGYERGDDLLAARVVGFTVPGPLRVWRRRADNLPALPPTLPPNTVPSP